MTKETFIDQYLDQYERDHPDERIDYDAVREQADCEWYDNEVDHGKATEYDLTAEQAKVAQDAMKGMARAVNAYGKEVKRERKPKAPKEPKPKTWEVSFALYQRGLKPEDIAIERSLSLGTIFSHLSRYLDSGQVSLDSLVSEEHQQIIKRVISKVGIVEGATAIKNFCPPEITYDEIRLMMTHNLSEK